MFVLLHTYRVRYGDTTLRQMINRYAPPSENDTSQYLAAVAARSGAGTDTPIDTTDRDTMIPVVAAMSYVENGIPAITAEVGQGWELYTTHKP